MEHGLNKDMTILIECLRNWRLRLDRMLNSSKQHLEEVTSKVTSRVSFIRRLAGTTSPDAKQFNCAFCDTSMKFGTHLV